MSSDDTTNLNALRQQIDSLDSQIVELLNERAGVVVDIGKLKQQTNAPIYAPDREKIVLQKVRSLNKGPLPDRCLEAVYRELMSGSFALEKPLRIGFLGPTGTFSHSAALRKFGSSVQYVALSDIPSVFEEVVRGHIDYGLVPVENSIGGGIVDTLDAFLNSSARICAEVRITIHHYLLARAVGKCEDDLLQARDIQSMQKMAWRRRQGSRRAGRGEQQQSRGNGRPRIGSRRDRNENRR